MISPRWICRGDGLMVSVTDHFRLTGTGVQRAGESGLVRDEEKARIDDRGIDILARAIETAISVLHAGQGVAVDFGRGHLTRIERAVSLVGFYHGFCRGMWLARSQIN